jgi:hypothetical protein
MMARRKMHMEKCIVELQPVIEEMLVAEPTPEIAMEEAHIEEPTYEIAAEEAPIPEPTDNITAQETHIAEPMDEIIIEESKKEPFTSCGPMSQQPRAS